MTQKSRADLATELASNVSTNGQNAITAAGVRTVLTDYADSFVNKTDEYTIFQGDGTDQTTAVQALLNVSGSYLFRGTVVTGAITCTSKNLTIDFDEGAVLNPNAELDKLWSFTSCSIIYKRFNVDGLGLCQIASYHSGGTLKFSNVTMTNIGWPVHTGTGLVAGIFLTSVSDISGDYFKATNFNAVGDGNFLSIGAVRGIDLISCGPYDIRHYEYDATGCNGEQIDMFQVNTGCTGGVIHHFIGRYNHNCRRNIKCQSGNNDFVSVDIQKASDFAAVSGSTDIGAKNLNCVDWATTTGGSLNVKGGYIDASGYATGLCQAGQGVVTGSNLVMLGPILQGIRNNPATGSPETLSPVGLATGTGTAPGTGLDNVVMTNFYWPVHLRCDNSYVRNCLFIDPVHIFEIGDVGNSVQTKGQVFENNRIVTQTAGYLNASRVIAVNNVLDARIHNNTLAEDGNATHATTFIGFLNASATGVAYNNRVPAGTTEINAGSATVYGAAFNAPILGTPASGTLTNCTGLPVSTGVGGLGTNVATLLSATSSGTGAPLGGTAPTMTSANITYSSLTATSGSKGHQILPVPVSGRFMVFCPFGTSVGTAAATAMANNVQYASLQIAPAPISIHSIGIRTSSGNGSAGASIKVGVYAADGVNGAPGTLLGQTTTGTDIGDSAVSTDYNLVLDSNTAVPAGPFWIAVLHTRVTTGAKIQSAVSGPSMGALLGATTQALLLSGTGIYGYTVGQTYASGMASPFGAPTAQGNSNLAPIFAIELA